MRKHPSISTCLFLAALPLLELHSSAALAQLSFAPMVSYPTAPSGLRPNGIAAADFDGDGDLDLATANFNSDNVSILLNNAGTGTFTTGNVFAANVMPADAAAADLDGDGDIDLAVANFDFGNPRVSVLRNNGNATFQAPATITLAARPSGITAADFTGDGLIDLAVSIFDFGGSAVVLRNTGGAAFVVHDTKPTGMSSFGIASGNLDGVNGPDLAVANDQAHNISVLINTGNGVMAPAVSYPSALAPSAVDIADLDNDGDLDIAAANRAGKNVFVHWNNGSGVFPTSKQFKAGFGQLSVTSADLNCDGRSDLAVVANQPGKVGVLRYTGGQSFAPAQQLTVNNDPRDVVARSFNDGGLADLATANTNSSTVSVLLNNSASPTGPATAVFRAGIRSDQFMNPPPGTTEYASPSAALAAFLAGSFNPPRDFDQSLQDSWFGQTFTGLPPSIVGATLTIRVRGNGALNDSISLGFDNVSSFTWGRAFSSLSAAWNGNTPQTFVLDLANLQGGVSLLSKLNADRRLDVFVQDDTAVDFIILRLRICGRTTFTLSEDILLRGQPATLTASGVPGPPGTIVLFLGSYAGVDQGTYFAFYDTRIQLNAPAFGIGFGFTDATGTATATWIVPAGPQQEYVSTQAVILGAGILLTSNTVTSPIFQ